MISVGGADHGVFLWRFLPEGVEEEEDIEGVSLLTGQCECGRASAVALSYHLSLSQTLTRTVKPATVSCLTALLLILTLNKNRRNPMRGYQLEIP